MSVFQSVFLGIIQGLTEFLPVSSSGHLAIFQNIFKIETGNSVLFDVLLHLGTLLVVFVVFRKDIVKMIVEAYRMVCDICVNIKIYFGKGTENDKKVYRTIICTNYRKFVLLIIVSTIPTALMGYFGEKLIQDAAATLIVPGICLIITGALLLLSDRKTSTWKIPKDVSWGEALVIGVAQGFATLPGLSRSGSTISACTFLGLDRKFAVKYSFILSIPAILGAAVLELSDIGSETVSAALAWTYVAGMLSSALVGFLSIRFMMDFVKKRKMKYFGYYCFGAGALAIGGYFFLR